jgi:hypothetical protein
MKRLIIFSAFITIFALVGVARAQTEGLRLMFTETVDLSGKDTVTISFTGLENSGLRIYEALPPGPVDACFETTDFSNARLVSLDRASLVYDTASATYKLRWITKRDTRDTCRVLIVRDGAVDGRDFLVWQRNLGSSGVAVGDDLGGDDLLTLRGDGSVRHVTYAISHTPWN